MLSSVDSSERVGVHHSSLKEGTRQLVEEQFKQGTLSIVIATVGFGMVIEIDNIAQVKLSTPVL